MKVDISNSVCYVKIVKEMKKGITENDMLPSYRTMKYKKIGRAHV